MMDSWINICIKTNYMYFAISKEVCFIPFKTKDRNSNLYRSLNPLLKNIYRFKWCTSGAGSVEKVS
jgi:hypothetical protein